MAGKSGSGRWIRGYRRVPGGMPLFCFPHAGGAASYFQPWSASLAPGIEVLAVQYPGREDHAGEPCVTSIADLADQIHAALGPWLSGTFAFFGHSMGAILAFEVARRIAWEEGRGPARLFVSGRSAPPRRRLRNLHQAPGRRVYRRTPLAGRYRPADTSEQRGAGDDLDSDARRLYGQ